MLVFGRVLYLLALHPDCGSRILTIVKADVVQNGYRKRESGRII